MLTSTIRQRFTTYFEGQHHAVLPSSPLTHPDPSLLFVNAGMTPLKPYFLGLEQPPSLRLTTIQRCIRTLDIDEVGLTSRHGSFFEMCGNFSFGDYFKQDSIRMSWDFLTNSEYGLGIDPSLLWVTVLDSDDETHRLWLDLTSVRPEQIQRRGMSDNYWSMGIPGPGGPCSEIYYDRGPKYGEDGGPVVDEDRFMEVWNLVFMQDVLEEVRSKTDVDIEGPLPTRCVDTGMGLERMSCVLQNVESIFDTDENRRLMSVVEQVTGRGVSEETRTRLRIITDHVKSSIFILDENVLPGNSNQSYTLRRFLRRSLHHLRMLNPDSTLLPQLVSMFWDELNSIQELSLEKSLMVSIVERETRLFSQVLNRGERVLERELQRLTSENLTVVPGLAGFDLRTTLGFPLDLLKEICGERGFVLDEDEYEQLWTQHREKSRG